MTAKEMFKQLDIHLIKEKPLTYRQDDGGYITDYLFNYITQCVEISEYEHYNYNKPQGSTTLSMELLQAINKQVEELGVEIMNEEVKKFLECSSNYDVIDYITNLQQENERLNQNNQSYQEEMTRTWKIADNYKSRCEKAIEYMKYNATSNCFDKDKNMFRREIDLLNILNGSDEK